MPFEHLVASVEGDLRGEGVGVGIWMDIFAINQVRLARRLAFGGTGW